MKKLLFPLALILSLLGMIALGTPAGLDVSKIHSVPPEVDNFKYWYGDIKNGELFYLGTKSVAGFETELHLRFLNPQRGKMSSAMMILGPGGLDANDCFNRYKKVTKLLNEKYGHYTFIREVKDPIIRDLVTTERCAPIRHGNTLKTYWKKKGLTIISTLLGDDEGYYIEIEYRFNEGSEQRKPLRKIL